MLIKCAERWIPRSMIGSWAFDKLGYSDKDVEIMTYFDETVFQVCLSLCKLIILY